MSDEALNPEAESVYCCDGDECVAQHPEGPLLPGWTAEVHIDSPNDWRVILCCPPCTAFWEAERVAAETPKQTYQTPCAYKDCDRSNANGHALFRVNPKGERGIFMCDEHARWANQPPWAREPAPSADPVGVPRG